MTLKSSEINDNTISIPSSTKCAIHVSNDDVLAKTIGGIDKCT